LFSSSSFYLGHLSIFAYGWYKQVTNERLAGLNKLGYSVYISRGAGLVLGLDGLLIVLPRELLPLPLTIHRLTMRVRRSWGMAVLRNLIRFVRPVVGRVVPLDENVWFHRQLAYATLFWTVVHVTAHCKLPTLPFSSDPARRIEKGD
jgi:NADPH oxidase